MDWDKTRGAAIKELKNNKNNIKIINWGVIYDVNKKLVKYYKKYTIKNNRYAKWQIV